MAAVYVVLLFHILISTIGAVKWCTLNNAETEKCKALKVAADALSPKILIDCVQGLHRYDCMSKIKSSTADVMVLSDSNVFAAGKYYGLKPIMIEKDNTDAGKPAYKYKAVAVVKKSSNINSLMDLKGKKACHTGVGRTVGWRIPVSFLFDKKIMPVKDCDNNVKNVANFFGSSCAYGAFNSKNDPNGDNPRSICSLCKNTDCPAGNIIYAGYNGAFRCLVEVGDVAFVKHTTYADARKDGVDFNNADFQLLCPNGTKKALTEWNECDWSTRPNNAIVVTPDDTTVEAILNTLVEKFGPTSTGFKLFSSTQYGGKNLLFSDDTKTLESLGSKKTYLKYLGEEYASTFENLRPCKRQTRWCTVSDKETEKCQQFSAAAASNYISSELKCVQGKDKADCMQKIQDNKADLIDVDGGVAYQAAKYFKAVPIATENYAGEAGTSYWAVAVAKKTVAEAKKLNINNLKGMKSCHTGYGKTAGWIMPIGTLIEKQQIKLDSKCEVGKAVGQFFSQSCAPGALEKQNNPQGSNPDNLCALCGGTKDGKCDGNAKNPYYSYKGSFRCLVERGADVAFVKHSTVPDNTDGKNTDPWAKDLKSTDFVLLCSDGTTKPVAEWKMCNLAKVPAHTVITSSAKTDGNRTHYNRFLLSSQGVFKMDNNTVFPMFSSPSGFSDLMFKDSTVSISEVPKDKQTVDKLFSKEYLDAVMALDPNRCTTRSKGSHVTVVSIGMLIAIAILFQIW